MKVSWDDYSQHMENKIHVPNYQPGMSVIIDIRATKHSSLCQLPHAWAFLGIFAKESQMCRAKGVASQEVFEATSSHALRPVQTWWAVVLSVYGKCFAQKYANMGED